jgi:hypothetical protein
LALTSTNQTIAGVKTFSSAPIIKGVTTVANAAAGNVGEYIESIVRVAVSTLDSNYKDVTSISLTAGDWMLYHTCNFYQLGAGTASFLAGISTTIGNSATGLAIGDSVMQETTTSIGFQSSTTIVLRRNIASTTTYYAKYQTGGLSYDLTSKLCALRIR